MLIASHARVEIRGKLSERIQSACRISDPPLSCDAIPPINRHVEGCMDHAPVVDRYRGLFLFRPMRVTCSRFVSRNEGGACDNSADTSIDGMLDDYFIDAI